MCVSVCACSRFAFLDESTSALDVYHQDVCMRAVVDAGVSLLIFFSLSLLGSHPFIRRGSHCGIWDSQITMISVAHRNTVLPYHDHILSLTMAGSWTLGPVSAEQREYARKQQRLAEAMLQHKFVDPSVEAESFNQNDRHHLEDVGGNGVVRPQMKDSDPAVAAESTERPEDLIAAVTYGMKSWKRFLRLLRLAWRGRFTEMERIRLRKLAREIGDPSIAEQEIDTGRLNRASYLDPSEQPKTTRRYVYLSLFACLVAVLSQFVAIYVAGSIAASLVERSVESALRPLISASLLWMVNAIAIVMSRYLGKQVGLRWRTELVLWLHHLYFQPKSVYLINSQLLSSDQDSGHVLDNVDQRLARDVRELTEKTATVLFGDASWEGLISEFHRLFGCSVSLSLSSPCV